jgi:hypothetical protein
MTFERATVRKVNWKGMDARSTKLNGGCTGVNPVRYLMNRAAHSALERDVSASPPQPAGDGTARAPLPAQ